MMLCRRTKRYIGIGALLFSLAFLPSLSLFLGAGSSQLSQHAYTYSYGALGQRIVAGVSSWLFGTNDTEEYDYDSILTDPHNIIIPSLANAHFGLVRSFFFHYTIYGDTNDHRTTIGTTPQDTQDFSLKEYASPAPTTTQLPGNFYEIERRVSVIQKIGATCLGVLPNITTDPGNPSDGIAGHNYVDPVTGKLETDLQFDEEVVAYLGNRCNLYEFGNEPDLNGPDESTYVEKWNEFIPKLKALNPNAKFIAGVLADYQGLSPCQYPVDQLEQCYMTDLLEAIAAGKMNPVPDAISFHSYPCENVDASSASKCLDPNNPNGAYSYTGDINQVRAWMQQIIGHTLPLGITEWNADPGSNPYMDNATFMKQFTADSMQTMINANLDFAAEFDAQSSSGYTYLDMFDVNNNDQPKAQETEMAQMINQYSGGAPPPTLPPSQPGSPGAPLPTPGANSTPITTKNGTPIVTKNGTPVAGTPVATPGKVSISFTGSGTPGQNTGGGPAIGPKPVFLIQIGSNNRLLDILFILGALVAGTGLAVFLTLARRRRMRKAGQRKVTRKKTA